MNVIKFTVEINKRLKILSNNSISELISKKMAEEFSDTENIIQTFQDEWRNIEYPNIRALRSEISLYSYLNSRNIKIFIFHITQNDQAQSRHSISFEIIAFGDMDVQKLLNTSFSKISDVYNSWQIKCKHIGETRIFIFPYNSNTNDIFAYDIKIRANLEKPINISNNEMFRWDLMTLILVASFCYNINLKEDSDNKNIALSILGSSLFYLITDLIIFVIIPLITQMGHRNVRINDLSSFVEAQDQAVVANNLVNNNQIQIPD